MPDYLLYKETTLASLPTSGGAWTSLASKSNADPGAANMGVVDQLHPQNVLDIAIRYSKDGGGLGKAKVESEIIEAMGTELTTDQPLNPYRTWGVYFLAADLVGMDPHRSTGKSAPRNTMVEWGRYAIHATMPGQANWNSLYKCGKTSGNNWGACARVSSIIILLYLKKHGITTLAGVPSGAPTTVQGTLDEMIRFYKRWLGDTTIQNTFIATGSFNSGWDVATYPSSQGVINAEVANKVLSGANVEDASRSGGPPLRTGDGIHYQYECIDGALVLIPILVNAGYADAASWVNSAIKRNILFMRDNLNLSNVPLWLPAEPEFNKWMHIQPWVANHLYPGLNWPVPSQVSERNARRLLPRWGDWLVSGNGTWGKVAGTVTSPGGTTPDPVVTINPPVANFNVSVNAQTATVTVTSTAGTNAMANHKINWGDGSSVQQVNEPTKTASHTYPITVARSFDISVTTTDANGLTSTATKSTGTIIAPDGAPVLAFKILSPIPTVGVGPLEVTYSFDGSFDPNNTPLVYHVDWGDGTINDTASANGTYVYNSVEETTPRTIRAWVTSGTLSSNIVTASATIQAPSDAVTYSFGYITINGVKVPVVPPFQSEYSSVHPMIGQYHLWVDPDGDLRIKLGKPTSPVDGKKVGGNSGTSNGFVVLGPADSSPPAGTPEGTIIFKET